MTTKHFKVMDDGTEQARRKNIKAALAAGSRHAVTLKPNRITYLYLFVPSQV